MSDLDKKIIQSLCVLMRNTTSDLEKYACHRAYTTKEADISYYLSIVEKYEDKNERQNNTVE